MRYAGTSRTVLATLVHTWKRDDAEIARGPIMSASSGTKAYLVNDMIAAFAAWPECRSISMLVLNGVMFTVFYTEGAGYQDQNGRPIELQKE